MFLKDDIYTSLGPTKLYNCWTDKVSKFDTSSFYNWEQDNLPLYDLEERTTLLWEKLGYPASSITGIAIAVSADAPANLVGCGRNIFKSVSDAIASLPQTINFPIVIEVANFGQLGDLILDNYKFGPKGSLEIINRNFAKCDAFASGIFQVGAVTTNSESLLLNYYDRSTESGNNLNYASSVITRSYWDSTFINSKLFSPRGHFLDSSCLSISSPVFSSISDSRLINNFNAFVSFSKEYTNSPNDNNYSINSNFSKSHLIVDSPVSPLNSTSSVINFKVYDLDSSKNTNDSISTYDVSTFHEFTNSNISEGAMAADFNYYGARGLFYGNKLNKIIITNCDGPIFIRNFFLDGSGTSKTTNYYGIEISDSNNVYLENNAVCRYRKAGLFVNNSNVKLLRGFVSTRIYDFDSSNKRLTNTWDIRRKNITFNSTNFSLNDDTAAGILANNSTIQLSSTKEFEEQLQNAAVSSYYSNGGVGGSNYFTAFYPYINQNSIFEVSKNANGIILNNSILTGGSFVSPKNNQRLWRYNLSFDVFCNVGNGIQATNSKISLDATLNVRENLKGIILDSSILESNNLDLKNNQKTALEAYGSKIIYNKNLNVYNKLSFSQNGQHIKLNNSKLTPVFTSGMDSIYNNSMAFDTCMGNKGNSSITQLPVPAIEVLNNSEAILISPYITREYSECNTSGYSVKGSEINCNENSKVRLIGAKNYATVIKGPADHPADAGIPARLLQSNMAAIYAGNSSQIEINGPTVIYQFGINLLAENNSRININPHKSNQDGLIDTSSFDLGNPRNHTAVELHSTRACIVVNNNSVLSMKDLGSFIRNWTRTTNTAYIFTTSGTDYSGTVGVALSPTIAGIPTNDIYTSGGSIQFYPNPIGTYTTNIGAGIYGVGIPSPDFDTKFSLNPSLTVGAATLYFLKNISNLTDPFALSSHTGGGYCVRALNNSIVDIHNVNFPCGYWQASSPYFDATVSNAAGPNYVPAFASKLFIWNIGDTSQLKASYLSVSSLHPRIAKYQGPSGVWVSGSNIPASGLPTTTPDTGSVSILDYYGAAPTSANIFAKTTAENYGPFRLYFSVDPVTNSLFDVNNNQLLNSSYGIIPQIYAQGYQPSGSVGLASALSSTYISMWSKSGSQVITSGYLYGSSVMNPLTGRILLDESAAETFANAKHCSVGKSGNAKLVNIQYPYTAVPQGSAFNNRGIKSSNSFDIERDN